MKSCLEAPSSKVLKDVPNVILQDTHKSIQKLRDRWKEFDKVLANKDEENSHLKDYSQKLLAQIKELKDENLENRDLKVNLASLICKLLWIFH